MRPRASELARERALAVLTREAAEVPVPELDWARIEEKVLAVRTSAALSQISAVPRRSGVRWVPSPATWASSPWPIAIAAAAAAALVFGGSSGAMRTPTQSNEPRAAVAQPRFPVANLSALDVGEVAETDVRGAVYDRPGVVRFALAPNSRIEVVANDIEEDRRGGITVALSRGSIHADVTPRAEGEIFAIEVEHTRIAVHGTSFTVSRDGDRVTVDVAHGSVAVGPVGHRGSTHGWLVVGPDRASFSLDGARRATWLVAPPDTAIATVEPVVETPAAAVADARASHTKRAASQLTATTSPRVDLSAAASKGDVNAASGAAPKGTAWGEGSTAVGRNASEQEAHAVAGILRQLETCYEKQASAFGVRFTVESSLALTLLPSGAIREGVFTPPLSPTLMSCADKAIGAAHFSASDAPRLIRIPVQLSRAAR
ncbi:MAG TPA: FecR family protein [Polyangiaceae bacterium]|nr:FecR family protein [Polyangiaceae bacterium]